MPVSLPLRRLVFLIVVLLTIIVALLVSFKIILPGDAFHWDESHHAVYAVWQAHSLQSGDWAGFWANTHRQTLWPFFHSWLETIFFLIFGISFQVARFLSLVIFCLTVLLVYQLSWRLFKEDGAMIGLVAALFCLTSPLMISFSAQNMLEGLGALLFVLATYCYVLAEHKGKWYLYLALGLVLGLSIVTKYNYAFLMLAAFFVVMASELIMGIKKIYKPAIEVEKNQEYRKKKKVKLVPLKVRLQSLKSWLFKAVLLATPTIIIGLSWFLSGDVQKKWTMLWWSKKMVAEGQGILSGFWTNILFYPKALMFDYVFSPWLGFFVLLALFIPLALKRYKGLLSIYLLIWVPLLLSVFVIGNKMNRLIYIFVPLIFIVTAAFLVLLIEYLNTFTRLNKKWLIVLIVLPLLFSFPRLIQGYNGQMPGVAHGLAIPKTAENLVDVMEFFHQVVPRTASFSTAINMGSLNPYTFYCYFHDWQAPFFTAFQAGQPAFYRSQYFLSLDIDKKSPYAKTVGDNSVNKWNELIAKNVRANKLQLVGSKEFSSIGIKALVYRFKTNG